MEGGEIGVENTIGMLLRNVCRPVKSSLWQNSCNHSDTALLDSKWTTSFVSFLVLYIRPQNNHLLNKRSSPQRQCPSDKTLETISRRRVERKSSARTGRGRLTLFVQPRVDKYPHWTPPDLIVPCNRRVRIFVPNTTDKVFKLITKKFNKKSKVPEK